LKPNGEVDSTFAPQIQVANGNVYGFAVQPDGRIVVSIPETLIDGQNRNVIRLLRDGSYDSSFAPVLRNGDVLLVETFPDGRILLGPGYRGTPGLARLQVDGHLDVDFVPFADDLDTGSVAIQRDGKIILPQIWRVNGLPTRQIVRLNSDGSHDETYVSAVRHEVHLRDGVDNFSVVAFVLQPDEKLLVSTIDASDDGHPVGSIIRLHGDGLPYIVPTSLTRKADGAIEFQVTAATNRTVIVEAASVLKPDLWTPLASFLPAVDRGPLEFTDPDAGHFSQRFYRVQTE
jgi:hypothetical protein